MSERATKPHSPKEFLKARRPERFSDSYDESRPEVDRSLLEYQLDTLTSRSQEKEFEGFARRLAEREICPNLRPQTGPTGGGDSKADAETYPVAESISSGWYVGKGDRAGKERWAFAFSTKQGWSGKVRSDARKIVATGRPYTKIFCITSRFARDKTRAEIEDELEKELGTPVTILDRTWILDRVFEGGHQDLAVEELQVAGLRCEQVIGPQDMSRSREFDEVEARIKEALASGREGPTVVTDALRAADLARMQEKPRTQVDGLYLRARRLAEKMGLRHQVVRALYEHAWTTYFWFEDVPALSELYEQVEGEALDTRNIYELELLSNLWTSLQGACYLELANSNDVDLDARGERLKARLRVFAEDEDRPSAALHARTLLLHREHIGAEKPDLTTYFSELHQIVEQCDGLVGFPLEPVVEIVRMLGEIAGEEPGYDELHDAVTARVAERSSGITAARMLVERGMHKVVAERFAAAIRLVGRALGHLATYESRHDLSRALFVLGHAYEGMDLLWAARGATLSAASHASDELRVYGSTTPALILCCRRLKLIELRLGRLPQFLSWHALELEVRHAAGRDELDQDETEDLCLLDASLGVQMLRAKLDDLRNIGFLPDLLERMALDFAAAALKFALGDEGALPHEFTREKCPKDAAALWVGQPAAAQMPDRMDLGLSPRTVLQTNLLGCHLVVDTQRAGHCVAVGEALIGAVEGLLAVGVKDGLIAREATLHVSIDVASCEGQMLTHSVVTKRGRPALEVASQAFDRWDVPREKLVELAGQLLQVAVYVVAYGFTNKGLDALQQAWLGQDQALDRAFRFTAAFGALSNTIGDRSSYAEGIDEWQLEGAAMYPLLRRVPWDEGLSPRSASAEGASGEDMPAESERDLGFTEAPHSQIKHLSSVSAQLWDTAGWDGLMFLTAPDAPPLLVLVFSDYESGKEIMSIWKEEVADADEQDRIRISIIRGINKSCPADYRAHVGSNIVPSTDGDAAFFVTMSRMKTLNPENDENLRRFVSAHQRWGCYGLTCGRAIPEAPGYEWYYEGIIGKRELPVRHAYEIGEHDPDNPAIHEDDDPLIPEGVDAPVVALLKKRRAGRNR